MDFLVHEAAVVDLSDVCGDYDIYTSKMIEERVEVKEGRHPHHPHRLPPLRLGHAVRQRDSLHGDAPGPGPRVRRVGQGQEAALDRRGLRQRRPPDEHHHPRLDAEAGQRRRKSVFQKKFGKSLAEVFDDSKYQLMHIEMFPHGIIHAECLGGDIDLLLQPARAARLLPVALCGRRIEHRALRGDGGG